MYDRFDFYEFCEKFYEEQECGNQLCRIRRNILEKCCYFGKIMNKKITKTNNFTHLGGEQLVPTACRHRYTACFALHSYKVYLRDQGGIQGFGIAFEVKVFELKFSILTRISFPFVYFPRLRIFLESYFEFKEVKHFWIFIYTFWYLRFY